MIMETSVLDIEIKSWGLQCVFMLKFRDYRFGFGWDYKKKPGVRFLRHLPTFK